MVCIPPTCGPASAGYKARLQSSLAVSADGAKWVLLNASPDIRQQINETPELHPVKSGPKRNSPIKAVVVTNADVDHITGLISLREGQPFSIYGSDRVLATLNANSIFNVCNPDLVPRVVFELDKPTYLNGAGDRSRPDGRSFCSAGQGCFVSRKGRCGQQLRKPRRRHDRTKDHRREYRQRVLLYSGLRGD